MKHLLMALFGSLNILTLACAQAQPATAPSVSAKAPVVAGETIVVPTQPAQTAPAAQPATPPAAAAAPLPEAAPEAASAEGQPVEGQEAKEEEPLGIKVAVILPKKGSRFDAVTQYAVDGLLAANYASEKPAEILLIRPSASGTVADELTEAAKAGAMVAIGPLARDEVERVSELPYLPLPVISLNQVDLNTEVPLTPEEIEERRVKAEAQRMADEAAKELNKPAAAPGSADEPTPEGAAHATAAAASDNPVSPEEKAAQDALSEPASRATIATDIQIPGLVLAKDIPESDVRYEPRVFPRGLLMMGLSMIHDATYVADLGLKALPRLTEAGERPKTLILEENRPLEKRIASSFQKVLIERGFAADRLTINLKDFKKITQFFELVIEDDDPEIDPEDLIDQELDPVAWRQQQLRLRKEEAEKRAMAAFAEPPYYAIFMALDSKTASQIRPRLPLRSRIWSTSAVYPGDPVTNPSARALTYDLKQVGFVECPFVLNFDAAAFEEKYHVPAPASLLQKRLFALGADALQVALQVARGQSAGSVDGLTGKLSFDLEASPAVVRQSQTAMIQSGRIATMTPDELIGYQVVAPGIHPLLQQAADADADKKAEPASAPETKLTPVTPLLLVSPMAPKP